MRLAILSDIHGNLIALESILTDLSRRAPDVIINLGDCATGPLWPRETCELLISLNLRTVRGNHDRWLAHPGASDIPLGAQELLKQTRSTLTAEQCDWLGALPSELRLNDGIVAVHGSPATDLEYLLHEREGSRLAIASTAAVRRRLSATDAQLVLCGHSHTAHVAHIGNAQLVINPGSVGCPRYADELNADECEAGSPHARYAIATKQGSKWATELIALPYNWEHAADRAYDNGNRLWARAFSDERK